MGALLVNLAAVGVICFCIGFVVARVRRYRARDRSLELRSVADEHQVEQYARDVERGLDPDPDPAATSADGQPPHTSGP